MVMALNSRYKVKSRLAALILCLALQLTACAKPATWQEQYDLGLRYLSEGSYEEAILAFTAAIEIDPKQAEAYIGLADAYIGQGDVDRAMKVLQKGYNETGNSDLQDKMIELDDSSASLTLSAGQLAIEILSSNSMKVTLQDANMQPVYTIEEQKEGDSGSDYSWSIDFADGVSNEIWGISTSGAKSELSAGAYSVAQMSHGIWQYERYEYKDGRRGFCSAFGVANADISVSSQDGEITWMVIFPDNSNTIEIDLRELRWVITEIVRKDETDPFVSSSYVETRGYYVQDGQLILAGTLEDINYQR